MPTTNPVLEVCNDIPIKKCNTYLLRFDAVTWKNLILESERTGLPIRKILTYSSRPCEACASTDVIVFEKGKEIRVRRGIFSRHIPQSSGISIIKQRKNAEK